MPDDSPSELERRAKLDAIQKEKLDELHERSRQDELSKYDERRKGATRAAHDMERSRLEAEARDPTNSPEMLEAMIPELKKGFQKMLGEKLEKLERDHEANMRLLDQAERERPDRRYR